MALIGHLLILVLQVYSYIVIASVIISWLIAFEVINVKNQSARNLVALLDKVTEPVYRPLRKVIPPIGGIDITPIVVIFAIYLLQRAVFYVFMTPAIAS